jgi:tRNA pseudouridine38-40 synthase
MRFKIYLEYDGTRYSGWQQQKGQQTIQGELLKVAQTIFHTDKIEFYAAGRTDAGVHASNQVAHLDLDAHTSLIPEHIRQKFNEILPTDINILKVEKADTTFHARHDATARSYVYYVCRRKTVFGRKYSHYVAEKLDLKKMQSAAKLFIGLKDFQSFSDDDPEEKSTKVNLLTCEIVAEGNLIMFHLVGSHFLWKMVRRVVGVLIEVGKGKISEDDIKVFFETDSAEPAKRTVPAHGLFLEKVYYAEEKIRTDFSKLLQI